MGLILLSSILMKSMISTAMVVLILRRGMVIRMRMVFLIDWILILITMVSLISLSQGVWTRMEMVALITLRTWMEMVWMTTRLLPTLLIRIVMVFLTMWIPMLIMMVSLMWLRMVFLKIPTILGK